MLVALDVGSEECDAREVRMKWLLCLVHQDSANDSIISGICNMLGEKKEQLNCEMGELRIAEKSCRAALAILRREEFAWQSKLDVIKRKLVNASSRKKEASLMLKLHETLEKSGSLSGTVRYLYFRYTKRCQK